MYKIYYDLQDARALWRFHNNYPLDVPSSKKMWRQISRKQFTNGFLNNSVVKIRVACASKTDGKTNEIIKVESKMPLHNSGKTITQRSMAKSSCAFNEDLSIITPSNCAILSKKQFLSRVATVHFHESLFWYVIRHSSDVSSGGHCHVYYSGNIGTSLQFF